MNIDNFNFAGHKAIVRVDFNVPLDENGNITDDTRIRGALPTLKNPQRRRFAYHHVAHGQTQRQSKCKALAVADKRRRNKALGTDVQFANDCAAAGDMAASLKPGQVLLLENLPSIPKKKKASP